MSYQDGHMLPWLSCDWSPHFVPGWPHDPARFSQAAGTSAAGKGLPAERQMTVVSKGTLVKRYEDGSATVQHRNGPSAAKPAPRSLRPALFNLRPAAVRRPALCGAHSLIPQANPGSRYRCGKRT